MKPINLQDVFTSDGMTISLFTLHESQLPWTLPEGCTIPTQTPNSDTSKKVRDNLLLLHYHVNSAYALIT